MVFARHQAKRRPSAAIFGNNVCNGRSRIEGLEVGGTLVPLGRRIRKLWRSIRARCDVSRRDRHAERCRRGLQVVQFGRYLRQQHTRRQASRCRQSRRRGGEDKRTNRAGWHARESLEASASDQDGGPMQMSHEPEIGNACGKVNVLPVPNVTLTNLLDLRARIRLNLHPSWRFRVCDMR